MFKAVAGASALGVGTYGLGFRREQLEGVADGYFRAAVTIGATARVVVDYGLSIQKYTGKEAEYPALKTAFDERTSDRLLAVCLRHGGCYTKLGQHLSTFNHILPKQYTSKLSVLQNEARPRPFAAVTKTIQEELGKPHDEVFETMEETPIAAASLAQVHRGRLRDGREVCIKVQYPHLRRQVEYDLFVLSQLVVAVAYFFPEFDLQWLLPEAKAALFKELDFAQEGRNADITREVLKGWIEKGVLRVPEVLWPLTTKRVLAMELVDTNAKINDREGIAAIGVDPLEVADLTTKIFAEMIFGQGWLHTDPHPGNVWVRTARPEDDPRDRQRPFQIVLFDHGSYRSLSGDFRAKNRELWRAMLLMDGDRILAAGHALHAGEFSQFLPLIFTYRPIFSSKRLGFAGITSEEDRQKLRAELKKHKKEDWTRFMERLPRDMLFVMRTNDMMRAINKDLGGTTRMRLGNMGEAAVRGSGEARGTEDGVRDDKGRLLLQPREGETVEVRSEAEREEEAGLGALARWRTRLDGALEVWTFRYRLWVTDLALRLIEWYTGMKMPVDEPSRPGEEDQPRDPAPAPPETPPRSTRGGTYLQSKLDGGNKVELRIG